MIRLRSVLFVAAACALLAPGCGDDDAAPQGTEGTDAALTETAPGSAAQPLSPAGEGVLRRARDTVSAHCRQVAAALAEGSAPPQPSFERATAALEELAQLAEGEPGAEAGDGSTPRLALGDIAENLEGTNCDHRLVERIDAALAELPAE